MVEQPVERVLSYSVLLTWSSFGIKFWRCIVNGVLSCHPHHGVRSVVLILQRAAMLKITSAGWYFSPQLLNWSEAKPSFIDELYVQRISSPSTWLKRNDVRHRRNPPPPAPPQPPTQQHAPPPQILSFPSNFSVPSAMVCCGDLTCNWELSNDGRTLQRALRAYWRFLGGALLRMY